MEVQQRPKMFGNYLDDCENSKVKKTKSGTLKTFFSSKRVRLTHKSILLSKPTYNLTKISIIITRCQLINVKLYRLLRVKKPRSSIFLNVQTDE